MLKICRCVFTGIFISFWSFSTLALASTPEYKNSIEIFGGGYSLQSTGGAASSIGSLLVSYGYNIDRHFRAGIAYQNILSGTTGLGSSVSGLDLFGQYCFFSCVMERTEAASIAVVQEESKFGLAAGLGLSQRSFQLSTQTVGFAGPMFKVTGNYFWTTVMKALVGIQYATLVNGSNQLKFMTYSIGLGVDW